MFNTGSERRDVLLRLAWTLFLLGAFTMPMLVVRIAGFTVSDILFIAGAVLSVLSESRNRAAPQPALQLAIGLGAIAIVGASINAVDPQASVFVGLRVLYVWTIWQFGIRAAVNSASHLANLGTSFVLGAAASGAVAVGQAVFGLVVPGTEIVFGRVPGLATHVNGQGGALAVAAGLAVGLALMGRKPVLHYSAFGLIVIGLVLAGSITGMLAAAVSAFAAMLVSRLSASRIAAVAMALGFVWAVSANLQQLIPGAASPLQRLADTTGQGAGQSTLALRLLTDQFAIASLGRNPIFGVGLDDASGGTYDNLTLTHNMVLLVWYQGGLLLLVAVVIALLYAARILTSKKLRTVPIRIPLLASSVGAFVFSMTGPVLFDRWFWFPFVLAWALPVALARTNAQLVEPVSKLLPRAVLQERRYG